MSSNNIEKLSLPYAADLERINEIVQTLFQNKSHENPAKAEDVSNWTGINLNTISSNIKFLRTFGVITKESKTGSIQLTDEGKDWGYSLAFNDQNKKKDSLIKLLNSRLNDLVQFCKLKNAKNVLTYDDLVRQIAIITNTTKIDYNVKKGLETIIQILIETGIIQQSILPVKNTADVKSKPQKKSITIQKPKKTKLKNPNTESSAMTNQNPQYQNIIQERLGVDIKISINAKDKISFDNTLEFLEHVKSINQNKLNLNISKELESLEDENDVES